MRAVTAVSGVARRDAGSVRAQSWSSRLVLLVAVALLLLLAATGVALRTQRAQQVEAGWVLHTENVRYQLARILQLLADAHSDAQSAG
jgi:hypothetical protein